MDNQITKTGREEEQVSIEAVAVEASALAVMERAEIDMQIATAKKYPRSISDFNKKAIAMVSSDEETAERCLYCRPVGKNPDGTQIFVRGESVRLAEIVASCFGNMRSVGIITEMTPRYVKAIGMAHDLESNYATKAEVVEATVKRNGMPYDDRMRIVIAKAAQSKAIRDAIFRIVPKSLCKSIIAVAQEIAIGKGEALDTRRNRVVEWINKLGIDPQRVYAAIGTKGPKELDNDKLAELTGIKTAIKDGEINIDEAFPPFIAEVSEKGVAGLKKKLPKNLNKKERKSTAKGRNLKQKAKKEIEKLTQTQPESIGNPVFTCPDSFDCGCSKKDKEMRIDTDHLSADENDQFTCPECGSVLNQIRTE